MPQVKSKGKIQHFPYTKSGKLAAKKVRRKLHSSDGAMY